MSLPCDGEAPVFREPWEAQAFALVVVLHQRGLFTWAQWAQALSASIARAGEAGDPDTGDRYYHHWLEALERLVVERGLAPALALGALRQAWRTASEITPHGQPVALGRALRALDRSA